MILVAQEKYFGVHRSAVYSPEKFERVDSSCTCNPCCADAGLPYTPIGAVPARPCQSCLPGYDGKDRCIMGCWG
jgi:hypothetical protein